MRIYVVNNRMYEKLVIKSTSTETLKDNYKENYSFMEFYHYMTLEIADGEIFKIISNVLRAFLHVHCDTVGYNKVIKIL